MIESAVVLTPLHYAYLIGVIVILAVMVLKKDTPAVCIAFLFILGLIGLKSVTGGIITVFPLFSTQAGNSWRCWQPLPWSPPFPNA